MPRLTIREMREGAVNTYEVTLTVYINATNEKKATSLLNTALEGWGKNISAYEITSVSESNKRFFSVLYPDQIEPEKPGT